MVPWGLNILDSGYSVKFGDSNDSLTKRKTFKEKLYQELGLVSFEKRRWCQKLCYSYHTFYEQPPKQMVNIATVSSRS